MKHIYYNPSVRAAAAFSLGLALAAGPALGDAYELAAGASDTLTSETAETTTYDSMSIAGNLTVSGKRTVQSTGKITVDGGTVTVSGNGASIGKQGSSGCDWDLGADGKVVIDGGKSDFAVGAKVFTILDSCAGQDGYIDFMEINNGGGFRPYYLDNNAAATARIKVSGTATLAKGSGNSYGRGLVRKGAFEILLQNGANLTFDVDTRQGSLNGGRDASENSVDIVGAGDVTFKMRWNDYPYSLRAGAKLNHTGSVTFLSGNTSAATFALEGDDLFGANVTNVCVAASGGDVTLDIAAGTTQTVRRLSFLRAGKDDVITGEGTLRINAIDADAAFEARLADDAALTIEKTGAQSVTAPCITNYPALKVLSGSYTITNDCTIAALTLAEGATLVVDGAAVHADAFDNAGGAVSYLHGGTLDFRRTVADGETEEVRNWTMNGGTSFVKDGAGTLHLYDPAVTGLVHVAQGTLSFSRHGLLDTYFHLVFKEQCAYTGSKIGTLKLQTWSWYAPNAATLISSPEYGTLHYSLAGEDVAPSALTDGQVTYRAHGSGMTFEDESNKNAHYIFLNNGGTGSNKKCFFACSLTNAADSANWQQLWVRLPDEDGYANGVDGINCLVAWGGGNLTAWTVESSATGEDGTWRTVSDVTDYVPAIKSSNYASGDAAKPMALLSYTQTGVRNLADTLAVQVDSGATLDFTAKTGGQMIDRIVFDVSAGGGTLKNVAAAAAGVLEIDDAGGMLNYGQPLPLVFDGVSDTENFKNWTVTVNGVAVERELVFRDGALAFNNHGLVIIFK